MSGPRFSIIPAAALRDPNISNTAKLVLAVLGQYANDRNEWVFPSQTTIADQIGVTRRTIISAINDLIRAKYLLSRPRFDDNTKARRSNEYFILYDVDPCEIISQGDVKEISQGDVKPVSHITYPDITIPKDSCGEDKKLNGKGKKYPSSFEAFWLEWRAQSLTVTGDSKKQAFGEWKRLTKDQQDQATRHAKTFQKKFKAEYPKATMKHACRYLSHANFEDIEPPPKRRVMLTRIPPDTPAYEAWVKFKAEKYDNPTLYDAYMKPTGELYGSIFEESLYPPDTVEAVE
jgi:hypothetical protein